MARFKKIAHRGASGKYPENTRVAFEKAIEAGADMIELDCQLTADGHVVVFHDEKLLRIARARGFVRDNNLDQLRRFDIGRWRGGRFAGERILTLEEALELFAGRVDLCLEIKNFAGSPPGIEIKVLFILSHYEYLERTIVSSFDGRALARVRELAPEMALGLITASADLSRTLQVAKELDAASLHVAKELATHDYLGALWDEGFDVYVWTVNGVEEIQNFSAMGVQGIFSDYPEKFAQVRRVSRR